GQIVRTLSHWRMDLPSKQSLQRGSRSPSFVRLAAISMRSHRTVLRGRDETVASLQASSLRLLWRTFWHGDASLVGREVLQEDVQKRLSPRKSPHPVRLGHPSVFHVRWWRLSCRSSCSCHAHAAACVRQRSAGRRATSSRRVARVQQGGRHALHRLVRTDRGRNGGRSARGAKKRVPNKELTTSSINRAPAVRKPESRDPMAAFLVAPAVSQSTQRSTRSTTADPSLIPLPRPRPKRL